MSQGEINENWAETQHLSPCNQMAKSIGNTDMWCVAGFGAIYTI